MSVGTGIVFQSICLNPTRRTPVWVLLLLATLLPPTQAHAQLPSGGGVEPVVVDSVDVEGNIRQADLTIMDMGGLSPGSAYTIFDIQRAFKAMWATGHFKDIRVRVEGDVGDGMVTLIWEVDEQDLLRNVAITGLTSVDPGDITDDTGLNTGFSLLTDSRARRQGVDSGRIGHKGNSFREHRGNASSASRIAGRKSSFSWTSKRVHVSRWPMSRSVGIRFSPTATCVEPCP